MPRVELRFEGGEHRIIEADPGQTVYQAAAGHGITVLTDCLEGACATCKARCVRGGYELLDPSLEALSAGEEAGGYVLLCQMEARSDCVVELPYSMAFADRAQPPEQVGHITALERVAPRVMRLELEPRHPVAFVPGQYAQIQAPGTGGWRAYSFAGPAHEPRRLAFYVRLLEGGVMSAYLAEHARAGHRLALRAPLGAFHLRAGGGRALLLGGGTGLAPFLAMLAGAELGSQRPVTVLHGAREEGELFARAALQRLARDRPRLEHHEIVERPAAGWSGPAGVVTDLLAAARLDGADTDVYVCGPPAMVSAAERRLAELDVPEQRVFVERFNPA